MKRELLRMDHVSLIKSGEPYLDNLNFQMFSGEIMGLISRSNKGHDQLIDLICYNHDISFGTIWYDGRTVNRYSYSDNTSNKITLIEQVSHLVKDLSVVDNLFVLRKGFKKYFINEQVLIQQAGLFFRENEISVNLTKRVSDLTSLERCLVELGKALLLGCRLVIIDNPGNFLSQHELAEFQVMLKKVRNQGVSVLYIGNHHEEVFQIADRTSLFSDGRIVKVFEQDEMTNERIAPYIKGWFVPRGDPEIDTAEGVLHFHHVQAGNLNHLRFVLHKGECLTLLDMDNQIAEDILSLLTGSLTCDEGRITLDHETYTPEKAVNYLDAGIAIIPKNSTESLLFPNRTYMENLTFLLDRKLKRSIIPRKIYKSIRMEYLPVVGEVIDEPKVSSLPLADQIALIYHRVQLLRPRVLVCVQPLARGDMFVRMHILGLLRQILKSGTAVLIITANISDTLEIADRLLVVEHGLCTAAYDKDEFDQAKIKGLSTLTERMPP